MSILMDIYEKYINLHCPICKNSLQRNNNYIRCDYLGHFFSSKETLNYYDLENNLNIVIVDVFGRDDVYVVFGFVNKIYSIYLDEYLININYPFIDKNKIESIIIFS